MTDFLKMSLSSAQGSHKDDCDKVEAWINEVLRQDDQGDNALKMENLDIKKDCQVTRYKLPIDVFTGSNIKPDVIVYWDKDKPIVLSEVVSSRHIVTVRKLCWNLVHHLIWMRNSATEIRDGAVSSFHTASAHQKTKGQAFLKCLVRGTKSLFICRHATSKERRQGSVSAYA